MSKTEKLITDFINSPFPKWKEVEAILKKLGYEKLEKEGSRVEFYNQALQSSILLHKPHPENTIKSYCKKDILKKLSDAGLL